jgi:hypothetical protein
VGRCDAEHHGQELLFECQRIVLDPIVGLEQPSTGSLGDVVQRVACGALHDLQQVRLSVEIDDVAKGTGDGGLLDKAGRRHRRQGAIRYLLEGPADAGPSAEKHTDPQHPFQPDSGNFHERAVPHIVGDGEHTAVREVDMLDASAVRM